jgi:PBP1b-binding outer membrane lipoprotein LpoB
MKKKLSELGLHEENSIMNAESGVLHTYWQKTKVRYPFTPKKRIALIFTACLSLLLLTGCTDNPDQSLSNSSQKGKEQTRQRPLKKVNVMTIEPQIISMANELPGRVEAFKTVLFNPVFLKKVALLKKVSNSTRLIRQDMRRIIKAQMRVYKI